MRLLLLFVLFVVSVNGDDRSDLINKFRTYISSFLSTEQLNYMIDLASDVGSGNTSALSTMQADMSSMIMEKLTTEQYLTGMMLFSDAMREFGTIDAMKTMAMQCASRPMEILLPLGLKLQAKLEAAKSAGATVAEYQALVFRFLNRRFTLRLSKKLVKACKAGLTHEQWVKAKILAQNVMNLSTLGITV